MSLKIVFLLIFAAVCVIGTSFANLQGRHPLHSNEQGNRSKQWNGTRNWDLHRKFYPKRMERLSKDEHWQFPSPISKTTCQNHKMAAARLHGHLTFPPFVPKCDMDGSYSCVQTWPAVGMSWTADEEGRPAQDSFTRGNAKCSKKKAFLTKYVCPKQRTQLFCGRRKVLALKNIVVGHHPIKQCKTCELPTNISMMMDETINTTRCNRTKIIHKVRKQCEGKHLCRLGIYPRIVGKECLQKVKYVKINYVCLPVKDGFCPRPNLPIGRGENKSLSQCSSNCTADHECSGDLKCCWTGCGKSCLKPLLRPPPFDSKRNWMAKEESYNDTNSDSDMQDDDDYPDDDVDDDEDEDEDGDDSGSDESTDASRYGSGADDYVDDDDDDDQDDYSGDVDGDDMDSSDARDDDDPNGDMTDDADDMDDNGVDDDVDDQDDYSGDVDGDDMDSSDARDDDDPNGDDADDMDGNGVDDDVDDSGDGYGGNDFFRHHSHGRRGRHGRRLHHGKHRPHGRHGHHSKHTHHGHYGRYSFLKKNMCTHLPCEKYKNTTIKSVCPKDKPMMKNCPSMLCNLVTCSGHENVTCRVNTCGTCRPEFFDPHGNQLDCLKVRAPCYIHRLTRMFGARRPLHHHVPRCMRNGSFAPIQCSHAKRQCWCVDEHGREKNNTRRHMHHGRPSCNGTQPVLSKCQVSHREALARLTVIQKRVKKVNTSCAALSRRNSTFHPKWSQNRPSRNGSLSQNNATSRNTKKWNRVQRFSSHMTSLVQNQCWRKVKYLEMLAKRILVAECRSDGKYEPVQCVGDVCWCVKMNGAPRRNTKTNGKLPNCSISSEPKPGSCPVLPIESPSMSLTTCESDGECDGVKKCCNSGRGKTCIKPVQPACPQGRQFKMCIHGDSCACAKCPANPTARCRMDYCNDCKPAFYDQSNTMVDCDCPAGQAATSCPYDTCRFSRCPGNPNVKCKMNPCNKCKAEFSDSNGKPVNCSLAQPTTTCQNMRAKVVAMEKKKKSSFVSKTRGSTGSSWSARGGQSRGVGQNLQRMLGNWIGRRGGGEGGSQGGPQSWSMGGMMAQNWRRGGGGGGGGSQGGPQSWSMGGIIPQNWRRGGGGGGGGGGGSSKSQRGQSPWSSQRQAPSPNSHNGGLGTRNQGARNQGSRRPSNSRGRQSHSTQSRGSRRRGKRSIDLENEELIVDDGRKNRLRRGLRRSSGAMGSRSYGSMGPMGSRQRGQGPMGSRQRGQGPMGSRQRGQVAMGSGQRGQGPMGSRQRGQGPMGSGQRGQGPMGSGSRWRSVRSRQPSSKSKSMLYAKRMPFGMFLPACGSDGSFIAVQCKNITTDESDQKMCWCVDENGFFQNGTERKLRWSETMICNPEQGVSGTKSPKNPEKPETPRKKGKPEKPERTEEPKTPAIEISSGSDKLSFKAKEKKKPKLIKVFQVEYHLAGSLKELNKMNKREKLIKMVIKDAAKRFEVLESEIKNIRLEEGSIKVSFDVVKETSDPKMEAKIQQAVKKLEAEVKGRNFTLILDDSVSFQSNGIFLFTIKEKDEEDNQAEPLRGMGFPIALVASGVCLGISLVVTALLIRRFISKRKAAKEDGLHKEKHQKALHHVFTLESSIAKHHGTGLPGKPSSSAELKI